MNKENQIPEFYNSDLIQKSIEHFNEPFNESFNKHFNEPLIEEDSEDRRIRLDNFFTNFKFNKP